MSLLMNLFPLYHWTLIGMGYESKKKCSSLAPPRSKFCKTQWACQINLIDVNFHLQKSFDKNLLTKSAQKGIFEIIYV